MNNDYLYSKTHKDISDIRLERGSTYIFSHSAEDRSKFADSLEIKFPSVNFIQLEEVDNENIRVVRNNSIISLRSSSQINSLIKEFSSDTLYIDVTGLDNRVCAALIRNSISTVNIAGFPSKVTTLYGEPSFYNIKKFHVEGVFNDLSEKIEGIVPLPGFATIFPNDDEDVIFIALLGFEGGRFTHMIENVQPQRENIIPVVGVPGFRPEYPHVAYWGNRRPLEETDTWRKVKYAAANSLVEVYVLLSRIIQKNPKSKIKLAPIGTKPHAIGAMLCAIKYPKIVELV